MTTHQRSNPCFCDGGCSLAWDEYDSVCEYFARRKRLPDGISSRCMDLIEEDEDAFFDRANLIAYARAMQDAERKWTKGQTK